MQQLRQILKQRLNGSQRIAVLGIGSESRGDDAAGMLAVRQLERLLTAKDSRRLKIFLGGAVPENITGQIKRFSPDHLIVIDAADIGKKAGAFAVFNPQDDITGISFSTHRLPLRILLEYLSAFFEYRATIIGIQPKRHDLYGSVSPEIARSASRIAVAIRQAVGQVRA